MDTDWITWQLCDSAFPAGALAHSAGLEAAWQQGEVAGVEGLAEWITAALRQTAGGLIPVVAAAWAGDPPLKDVDALCDSFLLNHVANRASRSQGQALMMACGKTFEAESVRRLAETMKRDGLHGHYAAVFGAAGRALEIPRRQTCELFMFLALRGAISSAVRLGVVGPLQGQNLQHRLGREAPGMVTRCIDLPLDSVAQTAPLADLLQGTQDRLYSRLFIS
jgi:urease accessory protein